MLQRPIKFHLTLSMPCKWDRHDYLYPLPIMFNVIDRAIMTPFVKKQVLEINKCKRKNGCSLCKFHISSYSHNALLLRWWRCGYLIHSSASAAKKIMLQFQRHCCNLIIAQQSTSLAFNKWLRVNLFEKQQILALMGKPAVVVGEGFLQNAKAEL